MKKIKLLLLFFVVMIAGNIASQTLQGTVYSSEGHQLDLLGGTPEGTGHPRRQEDRQDLLPGDLRCRRG